ncbi:S-layer protein domain-containing protein [Methanolobus mangrovi]|uniref:S-layer protein domain-containing protein n=1 Tax=Methanolobus mangrovi TaxID=3072977 RepID=A0AA51UFP5_9EURY|nr:S-layer protein domain-containing protein [Methanolobus mangrovi]WMW22089.1 S-layer protein domain-containing protein [Methanolobus mangrovi]
MLTGLALGLPGPVTSLAESSTGSDWILWTWINPTDSDFNQSVISIDGSEVATVSNTTTTYNATGLASGSHTILIATTNFTGVQGGTATDDASTASVSDTTGPAAVTSLAESSTGSDWILWTWTNPTDSDFNQSVISIDGSEVATVSNTTTTYNATGLASGSHTILILTKDLTGNDGGTATDDASTASVSDTTGPAAVTSLAESSTGSDWILWSWTNPTDSDFNQSVISIDGSEVATVSNTTTTYNATGLASGSHTILILTKDLTGNDGGTATDDASVDTPSGPDTTAPGSVTSLEVDEKGSNWIKWTWTNPTDSDFDYSMVYINNVFIENVSTEYYTTASNLSASTSYTIKLHTVDDSGNINTTDVTNTTSTYPQTYSTGDRIWEDDGEHSYTYTWDAKSFSGFFYDLESGLSSESMTISDIDSSLGDGDIVYETRPVETDFEHSEWGSYQIIGFMAEKYFAGYTVNTTIDGVEEVSMMSAGQLSKILIDDDEKESAYAGSSLTLEDGYELNIVEVDVNGNSVFVTLTKDGDELDSDVVAGGSDYVYKDDLGDADDVVILAVHFDEVFSGTETSAVFVEGIFQISDDYLELDDGESYGEMEITRIDEDLIEMENDGTVSLSKGKSITLMGKIKLIVADDNDVLRFAPYVDMSDPGTYELRGTVAEGSDKLTWTPLNFEGFYYDIDEGIQTERLELTSIDGRKIPAGALEYTSTAKSVEFEHSDWGKFDVIGFMAEKYFAGYNDNTDVDGVDDVSLISDGQLSKVLMDEDEKVSVYSGSSLILEEGYTLDIVEVDTNGERVLVELYQDGDEVDSGIVSSDADYVYETDLGDSDDVALIIIHFNEVFRGSESNAVFVEGIFQISEDYITLESGDTYGEMEVDTFNADSIEMSNEDAISLTRDKEIELMGDVGIKVADSNTLRYYPFVEVTTAASQTLEIDLSASTITEGDEITITVTARGASIGDATIKVEGTTIGTTDNDGELDYTPTEAGKLEITAEKDGYASGSEDLEVIDADDETKKMSIEVSPDEVYEGTSMTIFVLKAIGGDSVSGASVTFDGKSLGTTDSDGTITYTATEAGTHKLIATKSGLLEAELDLKVAELAANFEFSNLDISPLEIKQGKEATISVDIANTGTAAGDYTVDLKIDDVVVDSQLVSLSVGNSTTIEFTHVEEEPGTYEVKVGDLTTTYEVFEKSGTVFYVLGAIALAAVGGAAYLFTAGGWTVEIAQAKAAEAIEAVKELIGNLR